MPLQEAHVSRPSVGTPFARRRRDWPKALVDGVYTQQASCPVCSLALSGEELPATVLRRGARQQRWTKCPACESFFATESYDASEEMGHQRGRAWGQLRAGVKLGEQKAPLFVAILSALDQVANERGRLLDIGCSYGNFLKKARDHGYDARGFEIVPEAVEYVRQCGFVCYQGASIAELDPEAGQLDVISVLDCNYYWQDQRAELRAISCRLRPGGLLVMRVADASWLINAGLQIGRAFPSAGRRLFQKAVYDHRVSVPILTLLRIAREEGLTPVYTSVRDAIPVSDHNLSARLSYFIGALTWRTAHLNLAPGIVFIARKENA